MGVDPVTATLAGVAVAGTAISASAASAQGDYAAQAAAARAKAMEGYADTYEERTKVYKHNADMYAQQARISQLLGEANRAAALAEGERAARQANFAALVLRRKSDRVQGTQVTSYLKSGVELTGTPAVVIQETVSRTQEDIANILDEGRWKEGEAQAQALYARLEGAQAAATSYGRSYDSLTAANEATKTAGYYRAMAPWETYRGQVQQWGSQIGAIGGLLSSAGNIGLRFYGGGGYTTGGGGRWFTPRGGYGGGYGF